MATAGTHELTGISGVPKLSPDQGGDTSASYALMQCLSTCHRINAGRSRPMA
jgi:hypothetical protein